MKRGRPKLDVTTKRQHCVSCRLSPDELTELDKRRGKKQRGAWLRDSALGRDSAFVPEFNRQAYQELARAASNLHHVAKNLNMKNHVEINEIKSALADFRKSLIEAKQ